MKKKVYATPRVEEMELQGEMMMALSSDMGIHSGGNASDYNINQADVNSNNGWNLW